MEKNQDTGPEAVSANCDSKPLPPLAPALVSNDTPASASDLVNNDTPASASDLARNDTPAVNGVAENGEEDVADVAMDQNPAQEVFENSKEGVDIVPMDQTSTVEDSKDSKEPVEGGVTSDLETVSGEDAIDNTKVPKEDTDNVLDQISAALQESEKIDECMETVTQTDTPEDVAESVGTASEPEGTEDGTPGYSIDEKLSESKKGLLDRAIEEKNTPIANENETSFATPSEDGSVKAKDAERTEKGGIEIGRGVDNCTVEEKNTNDVNSDKTKVEDTFEESKIKEINAEISKKETSLTTETSNAEIENQEITKISKKETQVTTGKSSAEIENRQETSPGSNPENEEVKEVSKTDSKTESISDIVNMLKETSDENKTDVKPEETGTKNKVNVENGSKSTDNKAMTEPKPAVASTPATNCTSSSSTDSVVTKPPRPRCPKCNRAVRDKAALDSHVCEKEPEDEVKVKVTISSNKEKETFSCIDCNFTGAERPFSEHLMCHLMLRPYQCLHCKECFINRKETSLHVHKAHNGAKLSCALSTPRALKKAKALIKEANNMGIISFMARVGAKVPLEKDPERPSVKDTPVKDSEESVKEENKTAAMVKEDPTKTVNKPETSEKDVGGNDKEENVTEQASGASAPAGFSKLREALTASSTVLPGQDGPRILDSFSLNDEAEQNNEQTERMEEGEPAPELLPAPSVHSDDTQVEVMSFLGPEQPIYRINMDDNFGSLLAPPPLIPAPNASDDNFPPPPKLLSASSTQPFTRQAASPSQPSQKNPNFFVCGFNCLFSSLSADEFQEHTLNFHSSEAFYPCFHCGHSSTNEADLVAHVISHTQSQDKNNPLFVCGNDGGCQFSTNMVNDYINHMRTTHPQVLEPMCLACGDTFEDLPSIQQHVEQNVLHAVNCPHCPSKATDRRAILKHISSAHPGKPKMVSVAKQLICHERKLNNYTAMKRFREMQPPTLTPAPSLTSPTSGPGAGSTGSVVDQILSRHDQSSRGSTLSDILTGRTSISGGRSSASLASTGSSNGREPSPDLSDVVVKNEVAEVEDEEDCFGLSRRPLGSPEESSNYMIDENGVRRRIYVPMSERQAENFKCRHCTFIARDMKRLHCHERSHGMPPTRKDRFKCMFCPQGFDSEMKFRLHITCHPGIIRFLLYRCNKCEFDTNKKDTIVKHITCNRDKKHRGVGPVEAQYSTVSRHLMSRVLLCERCDYMTRHKIHMAIHYQRAHSILRDKSEFLIESLEPTDTPVSSFEDERDEEEMLLTYADPSYAGSTASTSSPSLQAALIKSSSARSSPSSSATTASANASFDFVRPFGSAKRPKDRDRVVDQPVLTVEQVNERNDLFLRKVSQHEVLSGGKALENQIRKFMCPICEYLLPKAADLKNHVKRHSEVGQITLTMYRCKYCSCMSTAKTLLYEHLGEKHPGKPLALVKKIVAIDTAEVDKSFAETSVEESLEQLEEQLDKEIVDILNKREHDGSTENGDKSSRSSFEQLFVIPEGGETFEVPLQCPRCPFSSHEKVEIIGHVNGLHPEVKIIGSDEDVDRLARETKEELQQQREAAGSSKGNSSHGRASKSPSSGKNSNSGSTVPCQEDVLIVPDEPSFKEEALCSRCNFTTFKRKDMVIHLQRHHPDISVMGRNSYPMQVAALDRSSGAEIRPQHSGMDSIIVGSGNLDSKIGRLYQNYGTQMRCLICGTERPKKFFIHVHILRHLNIYLWKCAFCPHRGLQKYKMVDHIKKIHPGKAMSVRYLRVDVEAKVQQFMQQFDINSGELLDGVESSDPGDAASRSSSPWTCKQEAGSPSEASPLQEDEQLTPGGGQSTAPLYTLGSEVLDEKLNCLYDFGDGVFYKCLACPNQFQRRFAIHRHIIMAHLKVNLLKCGLCPMESVERHLLIDHSLACHSQSPITITALDVDLTQAVSDFLARVASGELTDNNAEGDQKDTNGSANGFSPEHDDSSASASSFTSSNRFNTHLKTKFGSGGGSNKFRPTMSPSKQQMYRSGKSGRSGVKGGFRSVLTSGKDAKKVKKGFNAVDPDVIMLGRDALDRELRCLYQPRPNGSLRCLVCRWEFPRKYPLHRHMMLKHLRMMLVGCPYCKFEGVEKYNVSSHIKEEHPNMPINIKYVQPDVRIRVKEFVDDMAMSGGGRYGADLIKKPTSSRDKFSSSSTSSKSSPLKLKIEIKGRGDEGREEEDGEGDEEENENGDVGKKSPAVGGLVVAMFGKKKANKPESDAENSGDLKVKKEVQDDEFDDDEAGNNDEEFDDEDASNLESYKNGDEDGDDHADEMGDSSEATGEVTLKRPLMESYAPGAYRPCGGKPKALDVITNIKVLKAREGGSTKFYCELCKFTSLHRSNIVRHIYKIHEKYQTHTCPVCNYQTLSLLLMEGHMEKSHPGVEYSEDSFTLNPPRSKPRFTPSPNYNVIGGARPVLGPKSFQKRRQDMIASIDAPAASSSKGAKQFACAYCHYETNTQEDILQHTRDHHSNGEESSKSPSASSSASSASFSSKSKSSASACWDGSKKAIKRSLSPGSSSNFNSSSFSRKATSAFREPPPPKRRKRFVFEKGDELYHCHDCGTRETSLGRIEDHCAFEHSGQTMNVKRIPAWRFVCKSCVVKTMATSKMKYHLNRHVSYRPYTCNNCGAFFPSPDQCRRHSRSQGHDDQYTYVRVARKEARVEELLSQARQLAIKIQDEAVKAPDFDISMTDEFITRFQESKTTLKRSAPNGSVKRMREIAEELEREKAEEEGGDGIEGRAAKPRTSPALKPPPAKKARAARPSSGLSGLLDTQHENVTIKCHACGEFTAPTVHEVREHHRACHTGQKFLWRDVERGFVCDGSGEALPEFDDVPSDSTDVGYTTKMSLGAGASPMRFKCKTCDFSSSVIQAMKSHLKSHQPKGFMCAYCSRSFSGKEKLCRHQQCLHPQHPQWTIHLRRVASASTGAAAAAAASSSTAATSTASYDGTAGVSKRQTARRTGPKASAGYCSDDTSFVCPDCEFTSNSLYHYRRHMASQHSDTYTRRLVREPGSEDSPLTCGYCSFPAETEAEFSAHLESHFAARTRQCAHCDYSAYDRNSVLRHIGAKHPGLEPKVVEIAGPSTSARGSGEGAVSNAVGVPLVVDMTPFVKITRLSGAELEQFGCELPEAGALEEDSEDAENLGDTNGDGEEAASDVEEDEGKVAAGYERDDDYQVEDGEEEEEDEEDIEEAEEEDEDESVSNMTTENMSDFINDDEEEEEEEEDEEEVAAEEEDDDEEDENNDEEEEEKAKEMDEEMESNGKEDNEEDEDADLLGKDDDEDNQTAETNDKDHSPEELARQLGLVEEYEVEKTKAASPHLAATTDTVILQFDGLKTSKGTPRHNNVGTTEEIKDRKDATLLSAQIGDEKDHLNDDDGGDDDDDDEEVDTVTFDTDITLASPLPMISLGDGVALSPVRMDSPATQEQEAEMLFDV